MKKIKNKSKDIFMQIINDAHYLRVDAEHPLELRLGLNSRGEKTIRFIGNFKKAKIRGTKIIDVNHYTINGKNILSFSLINREYEDLFYIFCDDLILLSRNIKQEDGYIFLINRFDKWRSFGHTSRKYLSENEIKGLIGELTLLEYFIKKYDSSVAISGWTGPEPLKKDFSFQDGWYEVKTITKETHITISSIGQLESDQVGYLTVINLEKLSSEAQGVHLGMLVDNILTFLEFREDQAKFKLKLAEVGYYQEEDYYNHFVYRISSTTFYKVDKDFPVLRRSMLPQEINELRYELILNMLERFKCDLL